MKKLSNIEGITDQDIVSVIRESLTLPKKQEKRPQPLNEA